MEVGLRGSPTWLDAGRLMTGSDHRNTDEMRERLERAEMARQRERIRARQYLEIAEVMMIALDREGRVTLANRKACEVLEQDLHDLLGADWIGTCVPARQHAKVREFFDRLVTGRESPPMRQENLVVTGSGDERLIAWRNTVIYDADGRVLETLSSGEDVTEYHKTEQQLRDSEEKYQELFELGMEAVFLIDNESGLILEANSAASDMYGYTREELLERRNVDLSAEEEQTQKVTRSTAEGSVVVPQRQHRRKDGTVFPVEITGRFFELKGRSVHVAAIRDLTTRHSLEEQLRQAQKMESVGQLAGGVAHDFNNLLTVILGSAELMAEHLRAADPLQEDLREIKEAGNRAKSLTSQLLAFSRRQVLQPRVIDLTELVRDMDRLLRRLIGEDIELRTAIATDTWPVEADRGQIESILVNLAVNARDAMPKGGKLTIETANADLDDSYAREHVGVEPGDYAMVAVTDDGVGMDAQTRERVFEPFFTTKTMETGTGLGLSMVYGIVRQHGGFIWLETEPGLGSCFKIYLPRVVGGPATGPDARETGAAPRSQPGETVLVVEDERGVRRLVARMLTRIGYQVLVARDGLDAETVANDHDGPIHLLLTDVVMPGLGGKQVADRLAATHPDMRVLYMSGYTDDTIVDHGVLDPGTQFIQKPFSGAAVARRVREVLDSDRPDLTRHDPTRPDLD